MTLTQHLSQMTLSAFVAPAAVIGGSFLIPVPALAGCYPSSAVSDYKDYRATTSKKNALRISLDEHYDGTADCRVKINAKFLKREEWKPF